MVQRLWIRGEIGERMSLSPLFIQALTCRFKVRELGSVLLNSNHKIGSHNRDGAESNSVAAIFALTQTIRSEIPSFWMRSCSIT